MPTVNSLCRSFSQRRKSSKPRDLHIRKVSFSGCSLSSGSDFSDFSSPLSASTIRGPPTGRFDPLGAHPAYPSPPPRLHDRPILSPERRHGSDADEGASLFFFFEDGEEDCARGRSRYSRHHNILQLPPHAGPTDHASHADTDDDYFLGMPRRPPMPCSRWSESTIATLDDFATADGDSSDDADSLDGDAEHMVVQPQRGHQSMPNFSYKRVTVTRRPPVQTLDSLDEFIKRGGWKRRGIVFQNYQDDDEGFLL